MVSALRNRQVLESNLREWVTNELIKFGKGSHKKLAEHLGKHVNTISYMAQTDLNKRQDKIDAVDLMLMIQFFGSSPTSIDEQLMDNRARNFDLNDEVVVDTIATIHCLSISGQPDVTQLKDEEWKEFQSRYNKTLAINSDTVMRRN